MPATFFLAIWLVLSSAYGAAPKDELRMEKTGPEQAVVLSTAMKAALKSYNPDFSVRTTASYDPSLVAKYPFGPRQIPSAVILDLNSDGVSDVVLVCADKVGKGDIVALVSKGKEFFAYRLGEAGKDTYLSRAAPGKYKSAVERQPLDLKTEGVQMAVHRKYTLAIYHFVRSRFQTFPVAE